MLTDQKVKALKPKDKRYKVYDEKGLCLLIKLNGGKYWCLKYSSLIETAGGLLSFFETLKKNPSISFECFKLELQRFLNFKTVAINIVKMSVLFFIIPFLYLVKFYVL